MWVHIDWKGKEMRFDDVMVYTFFCIMMNIIISNINLLNELKNY